MSALETLRAGLPDAAKDVKLNLQAVLQGGVLTPAQRHGVAIASAIASRSPRLREALMADAALEVDPGVLEDARAAAALMAMNNVYYRFRHQVGKESYQQKPARLRMNRLVKPAASKVDFELYSLAAGRDRLRVVHAIARARGGGGRPHGRAGARRHPHRRDHQRRGDRAGGGLRLP